MALIVQKFGGTSVGSVERIKHVATLAKREWEAGNQVIVVVSAMSGWTNKLVGLTREISDLMSDEALAEYDAVVASGEQVSAGLTALALQQAGVPSRSWQGWQIPFHTDETPSKARIEDIHKESLLAACAKGIPVVTGFQGITPDGRVSTLGRGGSDTTAVAIAAAVGADRCDIFTDVDGIYTTDPRVVPRARKLNKVAYEEMLEMASLGAKVLQTRSVEMAMRYQMPVMVRSSFDDVPGTLLTKEEDVVERRTVTGLTYSSDESRLTLIKVPNNPGIAAAVFGPLAEADINVDMIIQNISEDGKETDMTFTVCKEDCAKAEAMLRDLHDVLQYKAMVADPDVAKISVIGVGMRSHAGIAQEMFATLASKGINILVITTSEIKVSVLVESAYTELALRALHTAYGMDAVEENVRAG